MHPALAKFLLAASGLLALLLLAGSMSGPASVSGANTPQFDPNNFVRNVDNPFFPLDPGTTYFYEGQEDGIPSSTTTEVTNDTKRILGVRATVVHDLAYVDGVLVEETFDWYAQDTQGNVWYLGEDSRELDENGNVISTEGSWEAGVDGAQPGILLPGKPKAGLSYRQEYYKGEAEDLAEVLSVDARARVPVGSFEQLLQTKEYTPLEPGVVEHKFYAKEVGPILAVTVSGGSGREELVQRRE